MECFIMFLCHSHTSQHIAEPTRPSGWILKAAAVVSQGLGTEQGLTQESIYHLRSASWETSSNQFLKVQTSGHQQRNDGVEEGAVQKAGSWLLLQTSRVYSPADLFLQMLRPQVGQHSKVKKPFSVPILASFIILFVKIICFLSTFGDLWKWV